jgi:CHAD domain-containing protein
MIEKVVKKLDLDKASSIKQDLAYWLSKTPEERIAAMEFLRRQHDGTSARLQRTARVIQQTRG